MTQHTINTIQPDWPAPQGVHALQTTRHHGVSEGAYASLNLALHVGDHPDKVARNRALLQQQCLLPGLPQWLHQVHGTHVVTLTKAQDPRHPPTADAAIATRRGLVCAVMTADCLPVLLTQQDGKAIAAIHAGWRGLAAGVIQNTVNHMLSPPHALIAWLGAGIGPQAFAIGPDVRDTFLQSLPECESAFHLQNKQWHGDLYALARMALAACGVTRIHGGGYCTYRDNAFFSYRRDGPDTGRMASLIWLS